MAPIEAIIWKNNCLKILDQLLLPGQTEYIEIGTVEKGWEVINKMQVRGAPAIAIVGCLSLAAELHANKHDEAMYSDTATLHSHVCAQLDHLVSARPTAVNMKREARRLQEVSASLKDTAETVDSMIDSIISWCSALLAEDISRNRQLGDHGMRRIIQTASEDGRTGVSLLTICNTGSLATAGYGTALGVVRSVIAMDWLDSIFILETRPYLQGARLTALEAAVECWPRATLLCDGAAGALLASKRVDAAVVGADRVAANGDTANKIGTYQLAVLCAYHSVPFYVCAPVSSVDKSLQSGADISIEHRPEEEIEFVGGVRVAAPGMICWNPAFDVTPASLITGGIITEYGVFNAGNIMNLI